MRGKIVTSSQGLSILLAIGLVLGVTGCTGLMNGKLFKERAAETPAPTDESIDKSFFVDPTGKPKTFMCAWAPDVSKGDLGEDVLTPLVNMSQHCNIEFEIQEHYLVGKMINPSYPNDRSRWSEALKIPIKKHFYYERAKDAHGRETNEWIQNEARSHWSARPKMIVDLAGLNLQQAFSGGVDSFKTTSVEDIEWDSEHSFLGFSLNITIPNIALWYGDDQQVRLRVNFLAFNHDDTFEKIPYNQENSRFMNVLHVMGRRVEGIEQELFASHWDVRKTNKIYINGVPKELENTVVSAVYKWNKTFVEAGIVPKGHVTFAPIIKNLKHPMDLRYPAINYVSDRRISYNECLGVGVAVADVRNGQLLWGTVTMFGGALEGYINAYTPGAAEPTTSSSSASYLSPFAAIADLLPTSFEPIKALTQINQASRTDLLHNLTVDHSNFLTDEIARLSKSSTVSTQDQLTALQEQLRNFQSQDPKINKIVADVISTSNQELTTAQNDFKTNTVQGMLGSAAKESSRSAAEFAASQKDPAMAQILAEKNSNKRAQLIKALAPRNNSFFIEEGMTLENMAGSIINSSARKTRTYPEMLESLIMQLTMHEFGHFIGLGHQFKENILPEAGTVPSRYISELTPKATADKQFSNYTSVMGYPSGQTHLAIPVADLHPGPHDQLVLRYIYKGQYTSYDPTADDWMYAQVPASGKIPLSTVFTDKRGQRVTLNTAYFPQCNDYDASWSSDPFCNRWDRGSSAEDLVKSYFEFTSDNLLYSLYSVVGGGSNPELTEYRLWNLALGQFSRVRIFYDEMRRRLRSEPHLKPLWNRLRADKTALFEFSTACQQNDPTSPAQVTSDILRQIFADKGIVDLCRANAVALNEFKFFMNLPEADYTKIDSANHYMAGGFLAGDASRNFGHAFGSWYQMTNLPLKFSALHTVTSSVPHNLFHGWLIPNWEYDNEENRYSYSTLYPREYTKLISDTVNHNMRFAATGMDDTTTMGRSVLAAGALLPMQHYTSNDPARLPREFNELLDQQSQFEYSMVAVLITAVQPDPSQKVLPDHYKKFTAKIYDFQTGKDTTARDVFILPKGQIVVWANGMFIYPVTKMKFYEDKEAYVMAYKVAYDYEEGDTLIEDSVKAALMEKHNDIIGACINGFSAKGSDSSSGLLGFFSPSTDSADFAGFKIPPGISTEVGKEKIGKFYESIDVAFDRYSQLNDAKIPANYPIKKMQTVCDEAIRGVGEVSAAAAIINGYWLGITSQYIEK